MPWKVTCVMDERVRFVVEADRKEQPKAALCALHGISRDTGYRWLERYRQGGFGALSDLSRARSTQAAATAEWMSAMIRSLREEHPHWGPKKLRAVLMREWPAVSWPAPSTVGDLFKRHGLIKARQIRSTGLPQSRVYGPATSPNDLWCIDFKGWFRTGDGDRCDPLTVSDASIRYLLLCEIVSPTTEGVWPACERLFRERGQPRAFRMDNGSPFGSQGAAGLTKLSVLWVKLGIALELITPGCPGENGRHERMHRTLKQETSRPPSGSLVEQQARFDAFRREFNEVRPHEALGQQTPASAHRASERCYTGRLDDPWYDAEHAVHRVLGKGEIRHRGASMDVSEALAGELIGIAPLTSGDSVARFADIDLGVIDRGSNDFRRFSAPRPGRAEPAQPELSGM